MVAGTLQASLPPAASPRVDLRASLRLLWPFLATLIVLFLLAPFIPLTPALTPGPRVPVKEPSEVLVNGLTGAADFLTTMAMGAVFVVGSILFKRAHHAPRPGAFLVYLFITLVILSIYCSFRLRLGIVQELAYNEFDYSILETYIIWQSALLMFALAVGMTLIFQHLFPGNAP